MNFQGFGNTGASYFYSSQFLSHIIPRPEDIFGFEIYISKKFPSLSNSCPKIKICVIFKFLFVFARTPMTWVRIVTFLKTKRMFEYGDVFAINGISSGCQYKEYNINTRTPKQHALCKDTMMVTRPALTINLAITLLLLPLTLHHKSQWLEIQYNH